MRRLTVLFATICLVLVGGWVLQPSTATGAHATKHQKMPHQTIYVPARSAGENGRFLQTGFVLKKGLGVTIKATGTAYCNSTCPNDPNGITTYLCPITCAGVGLEPYSLIGTIGHGHAFFIGSGPRTLSRHGRLSLAFNDNNYTDNSGGYTVSLIYRCTLGTVACATVRLSRPPPAPVFTATPTNTPTSTPTATPTATPTPTATATSTPTPTATFTATPTAMPTATPTPTATSTPTVIPELANTSTIAPNPVPVSTPVPVYVPPSYCVPREGDDDNDDHGKPPGGNDHDGCP